MSIEKILIVDDEPLIRQLLKDLLKNKDVEVAENGEKAIHLLKNNFFDLVLTDMKMPKKSGLDVLAYTKKHHPETLVMIMTAYGSIENAVEAMKLGAFHYLIKPFSLEAFETIFSKAEEQSSLLKENTYLKEEISGKKEIIAKSALMKNILKDIAKIAKTQANVFISGESGTGKEVIAGLIHQLSTRKNKPFIKVNCAAIPETLVESEFFGHEKGAFTGALTKRIGRFELADKGSLLLDEVTEIPISLQPKLLRAVQEQEFERVGSERQIQVDVRFIATSNRNMQEAISSKIFREDLYYRLNVMPIHIPPLRKRKEDILPLAEYFLQKFCRENHKSFKYFSNDAKQKLSLYSWPGNVRELANIIERTVVLQSEGEILAKHIYLDQPAHLDTSQSTEEKMEIYDEITLEELEKRMILQTLRKKKFNKTNTAKALGISIRTLRNKLKANNLET